MVVQPQKVSKELKINLFSLASENVPLLPYWQSKQIRSAILTKEEKHLYQLQRYQYA